MEFTGKFVCSAGRQIWRDAEILPQSPYFIGVFRICGQCPARPAPSAYCSPSGEIAPYCKTSVLAPITPKTLPNHLILKAYPGSSGFSRGLPGSLQ
jgi:hypothetical protein